MIAAQYQWVGVGVGCTIRAKQATIHNINDVPFHT